VGRRKAEESAGGNEQVERGTTCFRSTFRICSQPRRTWRPAADGSSRMLKKSFQHPAVLLRTERRATVTSRTPMKLRVPEVRDAPSWARAPVFFIGRLFFNSLLGCAHMSWLRISAVLGTLAVAMGAFGAHALRERVSPQLFRAFETGAHYHLVHAAVVLVLALYGQHQGVSVSIPAGIFCAGIALFSGSLYAMAITGVTSLGIVTPFGGLLLIAGWLSLLFLRSH
jgi:uncharacterized membrane protein YgdD (TMEM256/DUF423 family)